MHKIKIILSIFLVLFSSTYVFSQETSPYGRKLPSERIYESPLSPQAIEKFQNQEVSPERKDSRTLKRMYGGVNFIDLRSFEITKIVDSGNLGKDNDYGGMEGFSAGVTWEFPVLARNLGGGTPIIKLRAGKTDIKLAEQAPAISEVDENLEGFIESLGVSEIYTVSAGLGYCYHTGFNCIYGLYNSYLTGQLSTLDSDGKISTVPTQLTGATIGMSSTFDILLGTELTFGLEYSVLEHNTPVHKPQLVNAASVVIGLGFVNESRYNNMRPIELVQ